MLEYQKLLLNKTGVTRTKLPEKQKGMSYR